jgi:acyl carrier protein
MISPRLQKTILWELKLEGIELRDNTTAAEVPGWDSLSQVRVLTAVEKEYGVSFRALEVMRLPNVVPSS